MAGRNLNGKFSICRIELQEDSESINYITVRWGFDSEEQALAALDGVAEAEAIPFADLAVVGAVFASDLSVDRPPNVCGFLRRWLKHWLTCVAVTCLFLVLLWPIENSSPFQALDRLGADAVIQTYEPGSDSPRVVVVDVGAEPKAVDVAYTLQKLQSTNFRALAIDFVAAKDLQGAPLGSLIDALKALEPKSRPISMGIMNEELAKRIKGLTNVRRASVDLIKDSDGVVRSVTEHMCGQVNGADVTLPTLAWAAVAPDREEITWRCVDRDESMPLLFAPILLTVPWVTPRRGIIMITKEMVDSHHELIDDAYVIVGAVASGTMRDYFTTPLGEYPGAVIHANAVWTLAVASRPGSTFITGNMRRRALSTGLNLLTGISAGAIFAVFSACIHRRAQKIDNARTAVLCFIYGLAGLLMMVMVLFLLGLGWTWAASSLITSGVVIGAFAAMLGAALETLAHVGAQIVEPIHWVLGRILHRLSLAALLLCVFAGSALATNCSYRLSVKGPEPQPKIVHGDRWLPFERVTVSPGISITMTPVDGSSGDQLNFVRPGVWILPPCPPRAGGSSAWQAFWAALNPREATRSNGATILYRGTADESKSGPLRELSTLEAATGPMVGHQGLALVWAGGRPPFSIEIQDEPTRSLTRRATTDRRFLWLPLWDQSDALIKVNVRDNDGNELRRVLRPVHPLADISNGIEGAIELFQTRPAYRMEAIRQLFELSDAGNELADRAIDLIRATGATAQ